MAASSYSFPSSTIQQQARQQHLQNPPPPSLRELQKRALLKILNLNPQNDEHNSSDHQGNNDLTPLSGEPVWKFLVFDKLGQDIISSVLRVSDLRDAGVTVHMQLKADRQQMEDVPASTKSDLFF
jgi:sec1 family domain-containing protein 1